MKIECFTKFLDGPTVFELGDICTVSDADGERFCANGWAKDTAGKIATGEPTGGVAKLDIHNSTLGVTVTVKGN